jgi:hypothetical protein
MNSRPSAIELFGILHAKDVKCKKLARDMLAFTQSTPISPSHDLLPLPALPQKLQTPKRSKSTKTYTK